MKKLLILPLMILTLFVSVNKVKADTEEISLTMSNFYIGFDDSIQFYNTNQSLIDEAIELWEENYSNDFPYYFITYIQRDEMFLLTYYDIPYIYSANNQPILGLRTRHNATTNLPEETCWQEGRNYCYGQIYSNSTLTGLEEILSTTIGARINPDYFYNSTNTSFSSVYPLINHGFVYNGDDYPIDNNIISLDFPPFTSQTTNFNINYFNLPVGSDLPSYIELYQGSYEPSPSYTEVNLNNYSYVALSLKNYNVNNAFTTNIITQGQLCLTPIYNYGMTEKASSTYQVERCSPYYDIFTPVYVEILQSDITNKAIYYLKAYDTSKVNKVKIDTNIFDITYITSQNENNPSVVIGGRSYPTIPYNELTSSATQSEEEGYISGRVENVFDISGDSNFITDLFSNPLEGLNTVWKSILSMFALIGSFIALLPETMQVFLYTSFSLGLVLGLIKILIS